jgi:hypothetical protein
VLHARTSEPQIDPRVIQDRCSGIRAESMSNRQSGERRRVGASGCLLTVVVTAMIPADAAPSDTRSTGWFHGTITLPNHATSVALQSAIL